MSEQTNNGGPAFPSGLESGHMAPLHNGMSLRDYFAAKAMQAFITGVLSTGERFPPKEDANGAKRAYQIADAMLAARGLVAADIDAAFTTATRLMQDATVGRESSAPDEDGWIEWADRECPVPADTVVDVRFRSGDESCARTADWWDWRYGPDPHPHDIVAYRIHRAGGAA